MRTQKSSISNRLSTPAVLITIGMGCAAVLNPQLIQAKTIALASHIPFSDTTKTKAHLHKKATHHKSNGEYWSSSEQDKKIAELSAQIEKQAEVINKYYNSEAFKSTQKAMEIKGRQMEEFYNRPELKKMQEDMAKAGSDFSKNWGENEKQKQLSEQMGEAGKKISVYFSSKEFKQLNSSLKKKYGIPEDHNYGDDRDENYKKYQAELESKLPPDVKVQTEKMKTLGNEMKARYESPEFKAQNRRLKELGDSLNMAYNNPAAKQMQKEMEALGKQMTAFQDNPEMKRQREQLELATKRLSNYIKSPEYKNYLRQMKKYSYNYHFNDDVEQPEKPEKPEAPEKPETPQSNN